MLAAGALGGAINHYVYTEKEGQEKKGRKSTTRKPSILVCILVSTGAAFLVPLFLNMIASGLVKECVDDPLKYLVFFGFCLIAAITSRPFIYSLSSQVLKGFDDRLSQTENVLHNVKPQVDAIAAKQTEKQGTGSDKVPESSEPQDTKTAVLSELAKSNFVFRTLYSVAANTNLDVSRCEEMLEALCREGLVEKKDDIDGTRWYLTTKGRQALSVSPAALSRNGS